MTEVASGTPACTYCSASSGSLLNVGNPRDVRATHLECWRCQQCQRELDLLTYWWDSKSDRAYCLAHRPNDGADLGGGIALVGSDCVRYAVAMVQLPDGVLAELSMVREETTRAVAELDGFRDRLLLLKNLTTARVVPTLAPLPTATPTLAAGDRCDTVRVETDSGSLEYRLLLGIGGSLRLLEGTQLTGDVAWTVNGALIDSVVATAAATETRPPFAVRFEGPEFCLECWCRSDEAMNGWLRWVQLNHRRCLVQRYPPLTISALSPPISLPVVLRNKRNTLGNLYGPDQDAVKSGEPDTEQTNVLPSSTLAMSVPTLTFTPSTPSSSTTSSPPSTPDSDSPLRSSRSHSPVPEPAAIPSSSSASSAFAAPLISAMKMPLDGGRSLLGNIAKKLHLNDPPQTHKQRRTSVKFDAARLQHVCDVFTASLEEIMEEQAQLFPHVPIPLFLNFLAEEVLRYNGPRTEGIFRLSTNHQQLIEFTAALKKTKNFDYKLPGLKDAHMPAALLKQWLRDLPVPLFPDYEGCLQLTKLQPGSVEEFNGYLDMVASLSTVHRNVAVYLIEFLVNVGDPANVPMSKMPLANLVLVFVPSFLRCPSQEMSAVLLNQPHEQKFVQTLVDYFLKSEWKELVTGRAIRSSLDSSKLSTEGDSETGESESTTTM